MNSYGLIFNDGDNGIWLGLYEEDTIREFSTLSDFDGVYEDLALSKFAFVEVENADEERVMVNDICTFEVGRTGVSDDEVGIALVTEMLEDLRFPSEDCDDMFRNFLMEAGKTN